MSVKDGVYRISRIFHWTAIVFVAIGILGVVVCLIGKKPDGAAAFAGPIVFAGFCKLIAWVVAGFAK